MTEQRIVRSILMSTGLALGVAGCPPEPLDDNDAGVTGGSATGTGGNGTGGCTCISGGTRATGGAGPVATGGAPTGGRASVPVCATVESLPTINTACTTEGESQCDPSGNQCVCQRQRWLCNTICASTYPTEPTPDSECIAGAACSYPSGVSCACFASRWVCTGRSDCPADVPMTGNACNGLIRRACDYPNSDPHYACGCPPNYRDASADPTWVCITLAACPTTQPAHDLNTTCQGPAICSYGSTRCGCWQGGVPWVCGLGGGFWFAMMIGDWSPEPPSI